jgi:hypothetical protein
VCTSVARPVSVAPATVLRKPWCNLGAHLQYVNMFYMGSTPAATICNFAPSGCLNADNGEFWAHEQLLTGSHVLMCSNGTSLVS